MRKVLTILLAMLVLSGCDNSKPIGHADKIGFASQMTRALINSAEDLQQQELRLYGAYTLDGRTARVFDAERLYYDATLPGWDYNNTQYWIMNAVYRFSAVCPYNIACQFSDDTGEVAINNYASYTGAPDLLYASCERDLRDNDDFSTVLLHFHHACAAVQFNLVNASSHVLKEVRNIRLVGLYNQGHFLCDSKGVASWRLLDNSIVGENDYEQPFGGVCTLPSGGLPVNLNVKYPLYDEGEVLVLPQTIYKTDVTLHLEYIKDGDAEYAVRNIELGKLGGNTPTEWKQGKKYEYNLTITDSTITAEVIVVDWVDNFVDL